MVVVVVVVGVNYNVMRGINNNRTSCKIMYKNAVLSLVERNEIISSELNFLWSLYFTCFVTFIFPNCLQGTYCVIRTVGTYTYLGAFFPNFYYLWAFR
jgi:hypothetical protein